MNIKIQSKTDKDKYLYTILRESKKSPVLVIFMSGFSGGKGFSLFRAAQKVFLSTDIILLG